MLVSANIFAANPTFTTFQNGGFVINEALNTISLPTAAIVNGESGVTLSGGNGSGGSPGITATFADSVLLNTLTGIVSTVVSQVPSSFNAQGYLTSYGQQLYLVDTNTVIATGSSTASDNETFYWDGGAAHNNFTNIFNIKHITNDASGAIIAAPYWRVGTGTSADQYFAGNLASSTNGAWVNNNSSGTYISHFRVVFLGDNLNPTDSGKLNFGSTGYTNLTGGNVRVIISAATTAVYADINGVTQVTVGTITTTPFSWWMKPNETLIGTGITGIVFR